LRDIRAAIILTVLLYSTVAVVAEPVAKVKTETWVVSAV
jgi:hypothetical protein